MEEENKLKVSNVEENQEEYDDNFYVMVELKIYTTIETENFDYDYDAGSYYEEKYSDDEDKISIMDNLYSGDYELEKFEVITVEQ